MMMYRIEKQNMKWNYRDCGQIYVHYDPQQNSCNGDNQRPALNWFAPERID